MSSYVKSIFNSLISIIIFIAIALYVIGAWHGAFKHNLKFDSITSHLKCFYYGIEAFNHKTDTKVIEKDLVKLFLYLELKDEDKEAFRKKYTDKLISNISSYDDDGKKHFLDGMQIYWAINDSFISFIPTKTMMSEYWDINSIDKNNAEIFENLIRSSGSYGDEYKELIGNYVNQYLQALNYDILYYRNKYGDSINIKLDSILLDKENKKI
ncbi:MAG: hypothetical protein IPN10_13670 [Saprospiraceae bacterium]|nr:hypothetical protein [Saprospiraceae bacterium]